ncbi:hypothetical protein PENSPDRAFT_751360 [Peniophora sp. CONT]|nr:hypothetical protein PENSPDRAFT_751360 [Peniophora sp. CONT]
MSSKPDILIVGAGPVGLVAALILAQNDVPFRIIDKRADFSGIGQRGSSLTPRSQEAYHFLGVLPAFRAKQGATHDDLRIQEYDVDGKPTRSFHILEKVDPTPAVPIPNPSMIGQDSNVEIMLDAAQKLGVEVELGTELVALDQDGEGVDVTLRKDKKEEKVRFAYIIGTDGAKGVARKLAGLQLIGETNEGKRALVGDVYLSGLDSIHWHTFKDARGNGLVARPCNEAPGLYACTFFGPDVDLEAVAADRDLLQKTIADITRSENIKLGEIRCIFVWRLNERMADRFRSGRVFLAGDAAHVHSPSGGQGLNSGLLDAHNLSWKLALVQKNLAPVSLLDTYEEERVPVIREMLRLTSTITAISYRTDAPNASIWKRPRSITQLGVHSRWSSIVRDELREEELVVESTNLETVRAYGAEDGMVGRLHAGDRAPDAPGLIEGRGQSGATSVFDFIRSTRHVVLVFDVALEKEVAEYIGKLPNGTAWAVALVKQGERALWPALPRLTDAEGHAQRAYGVNEGIKVAVIRPDGVVGALLKGARGLNEYFSKIFTST